MIPRRFKIIAGILVAIVVALSLYTWNLKRNAEAALRPVDTIPVAPVAAGAPSSATLFVATDATGQLAKQVVTIPLPEETSERAQQILRNLLILYQSQSSPHTIGPGSDVENVFFVNQTLAVVNFNGTFAEKHPSGILAEELTVLSVVATLRANNPQVQQVKFLIDGRERDTLAGHADLKSPLDAVAVTQVVKDLP